MAEAATKLPVKTEKSEKPVSAPVAWHPLEGLRNEVDRLFDAFDRNFWGAPFRRSMFDIESHWPSDVVWKATPAVDVVETDGSYEITAELPGMDDKNVEVKVANGSLTIKGEKQEEKEERKKDYYLHERHFGSFERRFQVPHGVDADKIEANFKNGVLKVTMPKTAEAQKAAKKIPIKGS